MASNLMSPILLFVPVTATAAIIHLQLHHHTHTLLSSLLMASIAAALYLLLRRPRPVYLLDYACFKSSSMLRIPHSNLIEHTWLLDPKNARFVIRILELSGLGQETYLPPSFQYIPPSPTLDDALSESQLVIFSVIDEVLRKTRVDPADIGMLVVNCSLFNPTPSLSAMIVGRYNLRSDVRSFNLSGMGCSAGLIAVSLAQNVLKVNPDMYALVVSTEIITPNFYMGTQRSMLLSNCLFRMGAAAVLLSNRRQDCLRAKYRLLHVLRTCRAADERAFLCVRQEEDGDGIVGVSLSKDLTTVAGEAVKDNVTAIAPLVLPAYEQIRFVVALIGRKVLKLRVEPYIPNFKKAAEHFCIHAGGRAVIDELQKGLQLSVEQGEASRMTLHRFGNTSSSSLWYELSYIEGKGRMRRGDRVWMIGLGSGFKCNSAIWRCLRDVDSAEDGGPWADCIDRYPVDVSRVVKL